MKVDIVWTTKSFLAPFEASPDSIGSILIWLKFQILQFWILSIEAYQANQILLARHDTLGGPDCIFKLFIF